MNQNIMSLIGRKKEAILFITALFLLVVLIITFVQPLKYRASTKLLVVQNYTSATDSYSISRSNQYLSNVLAQVVYSDMFFNEVMNSPFSIDENIFSADINKRKDQWQKMVSARAINDTGMIVVYTYYQDKKVAAAINQAIAYTMQNNHKLYHGLGQNVEVKIIDNTVVSDWPVKPNILLNTLFGLLLGLIMSFVYIYFYPDKDLHVSLRKKNKQPLKPYSDLNSAQDKTNKDLELEQNWRSVGEIIAGQKEDVKPEAAEYSPTPEPDAYEADNFEGSINNIWRQ